MRTIVAIAIFASTASAQAPGYLLGDLESAAQRDIPYLAVEARLRVAELTRASDARISRQFAEAAVRTGAIPCGSACYYAMRTLAGINLELAEAALDEIPFSSELEQACRALTEQAILNEDPARFLAILSLARRRGVYILPTVSQALDHWAGDERFAQDLVRRLADNFPVHPTPDQTIFLFDLFRSVSPPAVEPRLIRKAVSRVLNSIETPEFNIPDPLPFETAFQVHGTLVTTYSRAEAAYLRALAFGVAIDENSYYNDSTKLVRWAPLLRGLTVDNLTTELKIGESREIGPSTARPITPEPLPDLRLVPFEEAMPAVAAVEAPSSRLRLLFELARRGGLSEEQYKQVLAIYCDLLPSLDEPARVLAASGFYNLSQAWPNIAERDRVIATYANVLEQIAVSSTPFAGGLRDSGDLLNRLDGILNSIGRVPAQWPECVRADRTLLLRHLVHEAEQATLYSQIDATFRIAGGSDITLRGLRGRVVVIVFWRSECAACQAIRLAINSLNNPVGIHGIWAIAVSDEPEATVLRSLDDHPFWASIALDPTYRVARALGIRESPAAVVVDREGRVVARIGGQRKAGEEHEFPLANLERAIEEAGARVPERLRTR
jgi:peroxiredoxin